MVLGLHNLTVRGPGLSFGFRFNTSGLGVFPIQVPDFGVLANGGG